MTDSNLDVFPLDNEAFQSGFSLQAKSSFTGTLSSLIFVLGNISMLTKAWRTRDVRSYSLAQISLSNIGNAIHWLYVSSLPIGPIWFLHAFFTLTAVIMLIWCLMYRYRPEMMEKQTSETLKRVQRNARRITQTLEFPRLQLSNEDTTKTEGT